jgi:hypothetical protein
MKKNRDRISGATSPLKCYDNPGKGDMPMPLNIPVHGRIRRIRPMTGGREVSAVLL